MEQHKLAVKSKWFRKEGQYLRFNDPRYLDLATYDDISKSRELLQSAVARSRTKEQRARARLLLRAFECYEASAVSYLGLAKKTPQVGKSQEYYAARNKKRYQLVDRFERDPVLRHPLNFDKKGWRRFEW